MAEKIDMFARAVAVSVELVMVESGVDFGTIREPKAEIG
jgi:hypothetical protein